MKKMTNLYKLIFITIVIIVAVSFVFVLSKGELYKRDFQLSSTIDLYDGWTIEQDGIISDVDFPLNVDLNQHESVKIYHLIEENFDNFSSPAIQIYKYYFDIIIRVDDEVLLENINVQGAISNTKGVSDLVVPITKQYIGETLEIEFIGTINNGHNYNIPVPILGEKSDLYINILNNYPKLILINVLLISIGLILVVLGFAFRKLQNVPNLLNIGAFSLIAGSYLTVSTRWFHGVIANTYFGYILEYTLFLVIAWPTLISIINVSEGYPKKYAKLVLNLEIVLFFVAFIKLFIFKIEFNKILPFIQIGLVLTIIGVVLNGRYSIKTNNSEGKRLSRSFFPLSVGIIIDLVFYYLHRNADYLTLFSELGILVYIFFQIYYSYDIYNKEVREKYCSEIYRKLAFKDSLTGTNSRVSYNKELREIDESISLYKNLWAVCIDVNNLKYYNDTLGHAVGDELLKIIAKIVTLSLNKNDMIFRTGGDEFVIFLNDYDDEKIEEYKESLEKIRIKYNNNLNIDVTYAIGFCKYNPILDQSFEETIHRADFEMYENKKNCKKML